MKKINRNKLKEIAATFIPCMIVWLLLTMSLAPSELLMGAAVSLVSAWFSSSFFVHADGKPFKLYHPVRLAKLLWFLLVVLMGELIQSNVAMAKIVLSGQKPKQAIVKVPVEGITDHYALSMLANCITMTPGTITMDVIDEDGKISMYVQWIELQEKNRKKAGDKIKGNMEKWIRGIWE